MIAIIRIMMMITIGTMTLETLQPEILSPQLFSDLQHIVLEAELGTKKVERYKSSLTEFTKYATNNVSQIKLYLKISSFKWPTIWLCRERMGGGGGE